MRDRIPPQNPDAEKAVLGAMILDSRAVDTVMPLLRSIDFYQTEHKLIYQALIELRDTATNIDLLSLSKKLTLSGDLEKVGGASYLSVLTGSVPTSANAEYYANLVRDASILRSLITLGQDVTARCYEPSAESKVVLEQTEKRILEIAGNRQSHHMVSGKDMTKVLIDEIHRLGALASKEKNGVLTGIPTGYHDLDKAINGLNKAEFVIIAARTSLGKTTLAVNIASHIAIHLKRPVGYFSLEMPWVKLGFRVIASEARVDLNRLQKGLLKPSDYSSIAKASSELYEAPFFVDDTPYISLMDLRAQSRRMVTQHKIEVIFIDYISIISPEDKRLPRHEQVAEISRSLMGLSRELQIPIVALSQVTRDSEGKRPGLQNIRESGSLEQDADVILFLHRDREYEKEDKGGPIPTELIIAKNRQGSTNIIPMMFVGAQTRFEMGEYGN